MTESDAQRKANLKYKRENTKTISVTFFPKDMELYEYAKSKPNKAEYIRELIRADMEKK